jgi:hypothetical protein
MSSCSSKDLLKYHCRDILNCVGKETIALKRFHTWRIKQTRRFISGAKY